MDTTVDEVDNEKLVAPRRVYLYRFWENFVQHECEFSYERKFKDDIAYVCIDPSDTRQRAERAARKIQEQYISMSGFSGGGYDIIRDVADIIAAEFDNNQ